MADPKTWQVYSFGEFFEVASSESEDHGETITVRPRGYDLAIGAAAREAARAHAHLIAAALNGEHEPSEDTARLDWLTKQHGPGDGLKGCVHSVVVLPFDSLRDAIDTARQSADAREEEPTR